MVKLNNSKSPSKLIRHFSVEFKRQIVAQLDAKLITISEIVRLHEVSAVSVGRWRRKYSKHYEKPTKVVIEMESEALKTKALLERNAELERIIGQKQPRRRSAQDRLPREADRNSFPGLEDRSKKNYRYATFDYFRSNRKDSKVKMGELYALEKLSRQAHAQHRSKVLSNALDEQQVLDQIARLRIKHPMLGLKKLYHKLNPVSMGRDRFIALAVSANLGIERPRNHRRTTFSTKSNRYQNLLSDLVVDDINQVWVSDITYFWVVDRFYYLVLIMDVYSRRVVGYHASASLLASANVAALGLALRTRRNSDLSHLIHHSDKGTQYVFSEYVQLLEDHQIRISMANVVLENSHSERLNGIIKNEYLTQRDIRSLPQLVKHLDRDVRLYNQDRPHWELDMMSPVEYESYLLNTPKCQRTKMKIYVDRDTIRKQKFANQLVLF
jgi:putative transposase